MKSYDIENVQTGLNNTINQNFPTYKFSNNQERIPQILTRLHFNEIFTGREQEIQDIKLNLTTRKLCAVTGMRGVGKTALVKEIARDYNAYDHILYLEIKWGLKKDMVYNPSLIDNLQVRAQISLIDPDSPTYMDNAFDIIINRLQNLSENSLLVIDNSIEAGTADFKILNSLSWSKIIASRDHIPGAKNIDLLTTNEEDAKRIFWCYYSNGEYLESDDPHLSTITKRLGYHCLALEIVAKNAAILEWDLKRLDKELCLKGLDIRNSEGGVLTSHALDIEILNIFKYFLDLFNPFNENADGQKLLLYYSYAPGVWLTKESWQIAWQKDIDTVAEVLQNLHKKGWLNRQENISGQKTYQMHQLLAEILREMFKKNNHLLWKDLEALVNNLIKIASIDLNNSEKLTLLDAIYPLAYSLPQFYEEENVLNLYDRLWYYDMYKGNLQNALFIAELLSKRGEMLLESQIDNERLKIELAHAYSKLGKTHSSIGNFPKAIEFYKKGNEIFKKLYESNPTDQSLKNHLALSHSWLGESYRNKSQLFMAFSHFEKSKNLLNDLHEKNPRNEQIAHHLAISFSKLGSLRSIQGQDGVALNFFEKYRSINERFLSFFPNNRNFKNGLSVSYSSIGESYLKLGNFVDALTFLMKRYETARDLIREYPNEIEYQNGLAIACWKLSIFYENQGNINTAKRYLKESKEIWEKLILQSPQNHFFKGRLKLVEENLVRLK